MTFLYPYFLLLLFVPIALLFIKHLSQKYNSWAAVCDAHLLPFLTIQTASKKDIFYKRLLLALWCLATICLAGPAVLKKDIPTAFIGNGIAVVVDMSPAMDKQATEQMTRKLYDLLAIQNDTSFGLVLVDRKAYTALPMTQDKSIFQNIIPSLKEQIMPSAGQNISAGIKKADDLLNQSGFENGQILLITAGIANITELTDGIRKSSHPVHVLGVGSNTQKHPVTLPNGQFWGGQTPILVGLDELTNVSGIQYNYASLDDSDLKKILNNAAIDKIEESEYFIEQYQNLGIYGVLLLLPLTALLFRSGVLFLFLICLLSTPCFAGFWWRTEQELYQKQMQGVADFNLGQYEDAQKQFADVSPFDIEALYNLATTQAYAGKIQDAIDTYEQVLKKDPSHADAAYNLEYLKKQLPPPEQQNQQQSSQQQNSENSDENDETQQNENSEDSDSNEENQQNEDQKNPSAENEENDSSSDDSGSQEGEQEQQQQKRSESSSNNDENSSSKENNPSSSEESEKQENGQSEQTPSSEQQNQQIEELVQAEQTGQEEASQKNILPQEQKQKEWLDQIKPDSGRVLRYRLLRQYQEQQ